MKLISFTHKNGNGAVHAGVLNGDKIQTIATAPGAPDAMLAHIASGSRAQL